MENPIGYQGYPYPEHYKVIQAEPIQVILEQDGTTFQRWNTLSHNAVKGLYLVAWLDIRTNTGLWLRKNGNIQMEIGWKIETPHYQFSQGIYRGRSDLKIEAVKKAYLEDWE